MSGSDRSGVPEPAASPGPGPASPDRPPLALGALLVIVLIQVGLHLSAIGRYGWFRDELYYVASTEHLDLGYVDHPPLSIAVLAAWRAIAGDSLVAARLLPLAAGVAMLVLVAAIARELSGGRFAQCLAALCVLVSGVYLGTHHYYSMNAWDQLFWTVAALLFARLLARGGGAGWLGLGAVLGLGLLNKISVLWLGAGIFSGLLLGRQRRQLATVWPWLGGVVAAALFTPYLLWELRHGWPTLEFMHNATARKMVAVGPLAFAREQVLSMNPASAPIWIAGLVFTLFLREGRGWRPLGWAFVAPAAILIASGTSRSSYLAPAYPLILAPGAVLLARATAPAGRRWLRGVLIAPLVVLGAAIVPYALPVLPVETFLAYMDAIGVKPAAEERSARAELPQQYADMFGWEEMAEKAAKAFATLTPGERAQARVLGQDYGQAGAIDVLGRRLGLPPALSGHNSYWIWGPGDWDGGVLIILGGDRQDNAAWFESVTVVDQVRCARCMPYERDLDVSVGRGFKLPVREAWPRLKHFI